MNNTETTKETEKRIIIAYASGYEHGHSDTAGGNFWGDGRSETHDTDASEWYDEAKDDGTFDRELSM